MRRSQPTVRYKSVVDVLACGVLLQFVLGMTPARANDGVPAGIANIEKTHQQIKTIDLQSIHSGARLQDFCLRPDGSVVALVAGAPPIGDTGVDDGGSKPATGSQVCCSRSRRATRSSSPR